MCDFAGDAEAARQLLVGRVLTPVSRRKAACGSLANRARCCPKWSRS